MKRFNAFMLYGVFLLLYILLLFYALIFKSISPLELFSSNRNFIRSVNAIPFNTIYSYLSGSLNVPPIVAVSNVLGNIILFVPLGIYLQLLMKNKKIWISIRIVFLFPLFVEMFQFMLGLGAADVDDMILNCSGGLIGIFIYRGLHAFLRNEEKVHTIIVLSGLIVILIPVLVTVLFGLRFRLG